MSGARYRYEIVTSVCRARYVADGRTMYGPGGLRPGP